MMAKSRRKFEASFKRKAVELSHIRGNVVQVAEELGIAVEMLYRWRKEQNQFENNSFPGKGNPKMTDEEKEIARLKAELYDVTMDRDILKKAISIFSASDKKSSGS
jgi:transposase